jgi:adenine-specific DNA-methyltransferase
MSKQAYVFQPMLTCIGNKRKLVPHIKALVDEVAATLGKSKLRLGDAFAGSTVVSRELTYAASALYTNDLEHYSFLMAQCYLVTPSTGQQARILEHIGAMNGLAEKGPWCEGIVCELYAPKDTTNIKEHERCFYTRENALILDTLRAYIATEVEAELQPYCLAPLLVKASIQTNTAGVFKGFYKKDGKGCFGGAGENALDRILKPIRLDAPVWNTAAAGGGLTVTCSQKEVLDFVAGLPADLDLLYLDPPYNQHPYGSNYFMLNVIAGNVRPAAVSKVSGIPTDWNKSAFNTHEAAFRAMQTLLAEGLKKSKYLLLSYNNEGILTPADWTTLFAGYRVQKYEIPYPCYRGSRNLAEREGKVMEILYLISRV